MLVALVLLAAPGAFDAVFDPASGGHVVTRKAAFDAAVGKKGVGAAIRCFKDFEKGVEQAAKAVDEAYAKYKKAADAYWAYRKKTGANAGAVPASLNRPALDLELEWKEVVTKRRHLRTIQNWAVERAAHYLKPPVSKKAMSALLAGLKHRNPHQRWRCVQMLGGMDDKQAKSALMARSRVERDAGVLAAIVKARGSEPLVRLGIHHSAWQVRAAAAPLLEDAALRTARLAVEKGRVREDLGEKPGPTECAGAKSSSRRVVFCFDYPQHLGAYVIAALKTLPADAIFSMVVCGGKVHMFKKKLVSGSRDAAIAWIKKTKTDGRSDVYAGMRAALDMGPDTIFLITARGPGGSEFTTQVKYSDAMLVGPEIMAYNRLRGVRIHCAGPSNVQNGYWLEKLAKQFGGTCNGK